MYVVGGVPEPRHPTLAGATSTGPPVSTGAATSVAAVHGLGDGLGRVHCRGTLALQGISIVLQSYQLQAYPSINTYTMVYDMYLIMRVRFRGSDFGLVRKISTRYRYHYSCKIETGFLCGDGARLIICFARVI